MPKEDIPVKPVILMIEVPQDLREGFWNRPNNALHYWAFKNRPRAFVDEKIIFTFNRKPVAQAVVLKVEGPGTGAGEYKHWHKVYWHPTNFQKFKGVTASARPKVLYHNSRRTNRQSILTNGLIPQIKEYKDIERTPAVFFFSSIDAAKDYGTFHAQFINQALDIWECQIPEDYKIQPDTHEEMIEFDAWKSYEALPPENIRVVGGILVPTDKTVYPPRYKKGAEPQIEKMKAEDVPAVMEVGAVCFPQFEFEGIARESLHGDFSHSYVAKDGDKVVGAYLLAPNQLPDIFPDRKTKPYVGKKGIEGVALFLLPEYRGAGVGRKLRGVPLTLGYDYIWGQHFEDLGNLQSWVNFGRKHLMTYTDMGGGQVHITVMDMKPMKTADHNLEVAEGETYWAGEGNAASGILPICPQKGTVCLAMRSEHVMTPGVWGTIGGAVQKGLSPQQSAKEELREETGYSGGMTLIPAFVFTDRGFSYHNFIGVCSTEFPFAPKPFSREHIEELKAQLNPKQHYQLEPGWETNHIVWLPYEQVVADMQKHPGDYHPGMHKLFSDSRDKIEKALGLDKQQPEQPQPQQPEQQKQGAGQGELFPNSQDAKFRQWFQGSKVVDAKGNPLPVYHGTRSSVDFDTFSVDGPPMDDSGEGQPMSSGSGADPTAYMGAHFAVEPQIASQFATPARGRWQSTRYEGEKEMPRVLKVYLRITNPKDFGNEHNLRQFINQGKVSGDALDIAMESDGIRQYESEEAEAAAQEWYNKYENDVAFRTEQNRYLFEEAGGGEGTDDLLLEAAQELASQARGRLETAGHDGIHYKNVVEGGTAWIAFAPNQIKSAWAQEFNAQKPQFTAAWTKKAAGFAFKSFPKLWHVGTMNVKDKGNDSLEGAGLSVSLHPEEWQEIARIGGDLWELTKKGNKFVNFHRISPSQRKQIIAWGIQNGFVQYTNVWRTSWYNDEIDDNQYADFKTEQEAREEAESYENADVRPVENELEGTNTLKQRSNNPGADSTILAWDLLVTIYAEDELDCDGVWWQDNLDVPNLSAPRGVIFPSKLSTWRTKKVQTAKLAAAGTASIVHRGPQGFNVEFHSNEGARIGHLQIDVKGDTAIVKAIDVDENYQRQGIATKLYQAARVELKKRGVKVLKGALEGSGPVQIREKVFGPGSTKYYHGGDEINTNQAIKVMDVDYGYTRAETRIAAFQPWMKSWMTGDCWLFALALAHHMPNATFVGLAPEQGVVHHVGLTEGGKFYDVRGAQPEDEFNYSTDAEKPMHIVPMDYEQVMRDGEYGSWLGHEDEFNALPDMKKAEKAVRRVFPQFKSASADEPGLLWRAGEANDHHDYQPSWDYEPRAESDPQLAEMAVRSAQGEYQRTKQPFELWDVDLSHTSAVAMYIDGTCGYPVVLIDLEAHRGYEKQIGKSINHELKHSIQEAEGREYDEDEAEED